MLLKWSVVVVNDKENCFLRPWQTRTHFCGDGINAHDVSWVGKPAGHKTTALFPAQTWKHLLRAQINSEINQKHFLCLGDTFCVLRPRSNREAFVSATLRPRLPLPLVWLANISNAKIG